MLHALIMAGGAGTRFWPKSRQSTPKQLLEIAGNGTMIQQTVRRMLPSVEPRRVHVITNASLVEATRAQLPSVPPQNVIGEPCGRDTAACIGLGALLAQRLDPKATLAVMPADHVIGPDASFTRALNVCVSLAEQADTLVTMGIRPTYPSVDYGYIHRGPKLGANDGVPFYEATEFKEKPDRATAEKFVASGEYYWNSGMFVWRADTILRCMARHMLKLHEALTRIRPSLGTPEEARVVAEEYERLEKKSIDYGVMEPAAKAGMVKVVEAIYDWDDVGTWRAVERHRPADTAQNVVVGKHVGVDTKGCIVAGEDGHLVTTVGVSNLIVIHTKDATLVCRKDLAQDVKKLVDKLREGGLSSYL